MWTTVSIDWSGPRGAVRGRFYSTDPKIWRCWLLGTPKTRSAHAFVHIFSGVGGGDDDHKFETKLVQKDGIFLTVIIICYLG